MNSLGRLLGSRTDGLMLSGRLAEIAAREHCIRNMEIGIRRRYGGIAGMKGWLDETKVAPNSVYKCMRA